MPDQRLIPNRTFKVTFHKSESDASENIKRIDAPYERVELWRGFILRYNPVVLKTLEKIRRCQIND